MPGAVTPEFTALEAEVTRNQAVDASAVALMNGIAARVEAAKMDPAKVQAVVDSIRTSSDALAAAVAANTPAAEEPPTGGGSESGRRR